MGLGEAVPALGQGLVLGSLGAAAVLLVPPERWRLAGLGHCCPLLERTSRNSSRPSPVFFSFLVDVEAVPLEPFSEIVLSLFSANAIE